jgi:hypothetical protein
MEYVTSWIGALLTPGSTLSTAAWQIPAQHAGAIRYNRLLRGKNMDDKWWKSPDHARQNSRCCVTVQGGCPETHDHLFLTAI